jgi:chromate reductase
MKILAFCGSKRKGSFNAQILTYAIEGAKEQGVEVTRIDLNAYPLPLYDQDLQQTEGIPEKGLELKKLFLSHDALLIASPEYNSSVTPLLKNVIDWVSRDAEGEQGPLACFRGKYAALVSASPGYWGGVRGLGEMRRILQNMGVTVIAASKSVSKADKVLEDEEQLRKLIPSLKKVGAELAKLRVLIA